MSDRTLLPCCRSDETLQCDSAGRPVSINTREGSGRRDNGLADDNVHGFLMDALYIDLRRAGVSATEMISLCE